MKSIENSESTQAVSGGKSLQRKSGESSSSTSQISHGWAVLDKAALHGLAGEIVQSLDPFTEADPLATLATTLTMFGNVIGPNSYFPIQHTHHPGRINVCLVGETAKGRKGTSLSTPKYLFSKVDKDWNSHCVVSGLSSGEGVISKLDMSSGKYGRNRLFVIESEFVSPLLVMRREGNTLSVVIRNAFDSGDLQVMTRNQPLEFRGAHVSILGHITKEELVRQLSQVNLANGFANRFLWLMVQRSKLLPDGGSPPERTVDALLSQLKKAVAFGKKPRRIVRDAPANELWHAQYAQLSEGEPGLIGSVLGRAEAMVLRLSILYALLDQSPNIRRAHLEAALAIWRYADQSARFIFGESSGEPLADKIFALLGARELSRTQLSQSLGNHQASKDVQAALTRLQEAGHVKIRNEKTAGKSKTIISRSASYAK